MFTMSSFQSSHKRFLAHLTLVLHLTILISIALASRLPSFDSSASLVLENPSLTSLLRWDVFHYAHISQSGYAYEHEYAFLPGTPTVMRLFSKLLRSAGVPTSSFEGALLAGPIISTVVAVDSVHALYDLSVYHFQSLHTALLVSLLSLLSSSPATLRLAPYAEPLFTYLSYKGMLRCSQERFVEASVMFALASFFRSNGTMQSGYILWGMLISPVVYGSPPDLSVRSRRFILRILSCLLLSALPAMPFIWHQYNGYLKFCNVHDAEERRSWCEERLPLIYSFVQSEYWGVGPFRYWTLQQTPNFLLAAPVLALLVYGSTKHIRRTLLSQVRSLVLRWSANDSTSTSEASRVDPFFNPSLTPHAIHALILSTILLTSAHTQIALRFASALPFTYWTATHLFLALPSFYVKNSGGGKQDRNVETKDGYERIGRIARWWTGWSIGWGAISLVTWAVFLPPA